jgi:NAD(P)-dependent dehydrogenase (short-subunit alcohol dehydrogenase family)
MTELRFDGRVAVITGGGRGLGAAYARLLAERGCKVLVNDLGAPIKGDGSDAGVAQQLVDEIRAAGGEAIANADSVATLEGAAAIVQAAIDAWGKVDILIHNAGNVRYGSIRELSYDDFKSVIDVHLMGAFHMVKAAHPLMCDAGYGRIVLTSSIGGIYGNKACVNYGISKSGMIGLSNIAALEGEDCNVKSNVIVPSAPTVAWLAHENCNVTGEMIAAIGGRVARCFIAETPGVYRPSWTIEEVDQAMDRVHDKSEVLDFGLHGHIDHIGYSFDMAREGGA